MTRSFVVSVLLVVCGIVQLNTVSHAQTKSRSKAEETILKLEQKWLDAEKANKPEDAADLFANDAVFTDADGMTYGKADELNLMNKVKWDTAVDSDMKVISRGNTVIVIGKFEGKGKDDRGKSANVSERWTDVWMKTEHMGWQLVASQSSPLKD